MPASAVPSSPWYVAAAGTGARWIDRSPAVLPQSFEQERLWVGRRMAAGRVAIERSLSAARNIRRAGLDEDSSIKVLRALVDPNLAPVRALPREERELMIAANNGHLLAFD